MVRKHTYKNNIRTMESLPTDLIDLISNKCDKHTFFNVCLASKDVYQRRKELLLRIETIHVCQQMKEMITEFYQTSSNFSRVKYIHKMMRKILEYEHVLKENRTLVIVIMGKLDGWSDQGMCSRKCNMYKKKFESLIED